MKTTPVRSIAPDSDSSPSARFIELKKNVLSRLSRQHRHLMPAALVRRAMDEAGEQAERTGFPLLVFPLLAEETLQRVHLALTDEHAASTDEPGTLAACA